MGALGLSAGPPVSFDSWFAREELADVDVHLTLVEECDDSSDADSAGTAPAADIAPCDGDGAETGKRPQPPRQQRRRVLKTFPAHRLLLHNASEFLAAKLSPVWAAAAAAASAAAAAAASGGSSSGGSSPQRAVLEVMLDSPEEVPAAELLLRAAYAIADPSAPLRGASQALLLQVLALADRWSATSCEAAAIAVLASAPSLSWQTVTALFELPPARADNAAYAPLLSAAAAALRGRLGDLDASLLDPPRGEQLQSLPFAALLALLTDPLTRGTENAAYFAATAWLAARAAEGCPAPAEAEAELAAALRVPHLSPLYAATVVARSGWLPRHVPPADLHFASAFADAPPEARALLSDGTALPVARHPAWKLPARPGSAATCAALIWRVPLAQLRALHAAAAAADPPGAWAELECPPELSRPFQGLVWSLEVAAARNSDSGGIGFSVFVKARMPFAPEPAAVAACAIVRLGTPAHVTRAALFTFQGAGLSCGCRDLLAPPRAAWDEGAGWKGLVGADGCVEVRAEISGVR